MKPTYPKIKLRMLNSQGRAVLYEDYLAIENAHSLGMYSEASRTYYDEIRWVLAYQKRDWARAVHAALLAVPMLIGLGLVLWSGESVAQFIGLVLIAPSAPFFFYALYRLIAVKRGVASIISPRGVVEIGTDWPKSGNPAKDAKVFFETFMAKLELVGEIPDPDAPPPAPPPVPDAGLEAAPPPAPPPEPASEAGPPQVP
jgi:hypothetical protein